jgi:hypothetical protein
MDASEVASLPQMHPSQRVWLVFRAVDEQAEIQFVAKIIARSAPWRGGGRLLVLSLIAEPLVDPRPPAVHIEGCCRNICAFAHKILFGVCCALLPNTIPHLSRSDKLIPDSILVRRPSEPPLRHEDPQEKEFAHHVRAAIAHEWQRRSCDRQKVHIHAHVYEDVDYEIYGHSGSK